MGQKWVSNLQFFASLDRREAAHPSNSSGYQLEISSLWLLFHHPHSWAKNGYQIFKSSLRCIAANASVLNATTGVFAAGRLPSTDNPLTGLRVPNTLPIKDINPSYASSDPSPAAMVTSTTVQPTTRHRSNVFRLAHQPYCSLTVPGSTQ